MSLSEAADVATIVTGLAAVMLGFLVYRLTRSTDRWNKFDRRLTIYHATRLYLAGILTHGTTDSDDATMEWWRATKGYQFLFPANVQKLITETWDDGDRLDQIRRRKKELRETAEQDDRLENERDAIFARVKERYTTMHKIFDPSLNFRGN